MRPNASDGARVLIVGNPENFHVGGHLIEAAVDAGFDVRVCDVRRAFDGPAWLRRLSWRFHDRSPLKLTAFGRSVVDACEEFAPTWLVATGIAPLTASVLARVGALGVARINYLTDDPWNPAHRASWFLDALAHYDHVFSPRRANLADVRSAGCANATFLPFAYSERMHARAAEADRDEAGADVVFVGGADADRVTALEPLLAAGVDVRLYGSYWDRVRAARRAARGHADPATIRRVTASARIALCLVRRANRDGHVMRSFEIPAIGACMLAEDTPEHRELFGAPGEAVEYFSGGADLVREVRALLGDAAKRARLADAAHRLMTAGGHTYRHRLVTMLGRAGRGALQETA